MQRSHRMGLSMQRSSSGPKNCCHGGLPPTVVSASSLHIRHLPALLRFKNNITALYRPLFLKLLSLEYLRDQISLIPASLPLFFRDFASQYRR